MNGVWPWAVAGGLVGLLNGVSRWNTVSRVSEAAVRGSIRFALGTMALRLGLVAGLLTISLRQGILPGLSAFAGLFVTRWVIVLWFGVGGESAQRLRR